jgi:hypothetical protein
MIIFKPKNPSLLTGKSSTAGGKIHYGRRKNPLRPVGKIPPLLVEQSMMVSGKIRHGWRKNHPPLADILALAENSVLYSVTIFHNNSATGRLWSCGTPSLAWIYLESFLQCISLPNRQATQPYRLGLMGSALSLIIFLRTYGM